MNNITKSSPNDVSQLDIAQASSWGLHTLDTVAFPDIRPIPVIRTKGALFITDSRLRDSGIDFT